MLLNNAVCQTTKNTEKVWRSDALRVIKSSEVPGADIPSLVLPNRSRSTTSSQQRLKGPSQSSEPTAPEDAH
jgi:hypothetical protein